VAAARQSSTRSIWDGVYTDGQAKRGQATYEKACAYCHLRDLSGGSDAAAPPLAGRQFLARWNTRTLADLFVLMAETMPKDGQDVGGSPPVHVEIEEYLDIVAYVLMVNGVPAGTTELPADEQLTTLVITQRPSGQ
jgi:cytochrome c